MHADGSSTYSGTWKDGKLNGQGTYRILGNDGYESTYTGEWVNDMKNGQGTRTSFGGWLKGTIISTGPWKDDEMHGIVKRSLVFKSGTTSMTGEYINGKENGRFIITNTDGTITNEFYTDGVEVP